MVCYADVAINIPRDNLFTYVVEDERLLPRLEVGKRVLVPFRGRQLSGYLVGWRHKLKPEEENLRMLPLGDIVDDRPLFSSVDLEFYRRAAAYYHAPLGVALHAMLPGGLAYRSCREYCLTGKLLPKIKDPGRREIAERLRKTLAGKEGMLVAELAKAILLPAVSADRQAEQFKVVLKSGVRQGWLSVNNRLLPPVVRGRHETIYEIVDFSTLDDAIAVSRILAERKEGMRTFLRSGDFFSRRQFLGFFPGSSAILRRWQQQNWIRSRQVPRLRNIPDQGSGQEPPPVVTLTSVQEKIYQQVAVKLVQAEFSPFLIHGVTGSGKTEIYLQLIKKARQLGRGSLYLVPEIALTIQLLDRFIREFGDQVAVLHSSLGAGERYDQWRRICRGEATVVLGARSAVFAPLPRLGLIVVDEEHEASYKQESSFPYHGRDLALMRGQMAGCPVVLGSATPAVVTYHRSVANHYQLLELSERPGNRLLPKVEVVDLSAGKQKMFDWDGFSPRLVESMTEVLDAGRQVMLFLNKRGFSRTLYCLDCGYMPSCSSCSVRLTYHKEMNRLICHYCGMMLPVPSVCPQCHKSNFFPLGVGIQKLDERLQEYFPGIKVARLDRDSTRKKGQLAALINAFCRGEYQVLLGTQMLAKGLNFPDVDLVGVIFADLSLNFPEFTAAEKTFQLLTQVAGRAGRGQNRGKVIIQTLQPRHYSVQHATSHDYQGFFRHELAIRRELSFPPFSHLLLFRGQAEDQDLVQKVLRVIKDRLLNMIKTHGWSKNIMVMGPVPSSVARIKKMYRWQLLLKSNHRPYLHQLITEWRGCSPPSRKVSITVDIDPISFV
ncbi:MAG: primosomal protein N' [Pseudomonadota bacterium]|nr:primosomal protein N' [Pseudomonadota bacterium]